jgi:hypothetical protein
MPGANGAAAREDLIVTVGARGHVATLQLEIEIDSDPIRGWVAYDETVRHEFVGWIELAEAIESARDSSGRAAETLGWFPGAKRAGL